MSEKEDEDLYGPDARKPFYTICNANLDGSADFSSEGLNWYDDFDEAMDDAKSQTDKHGVAMFVIECVAVRKIVRGPVRVSAVKVKGRR